VNAVTNLVIANSKSVADFAIKQEGLDENRVKVIRNVLTDEWFLDSTTPNASLVVLNVANLIAYKGQETLLKAFAQVQSKYPHAVLRIIGDGPERSSIESLAQTLSVKLEITGAQPVTAASYQGVGVFVLSSREEGMSNSLMESMAAGLPIVATDVGGNAETLGDSGVLVNADNETELAQALLGLLADENKARALGARARERARSFFTNRNLAHEYLQAIQESSSR
jgi:glycosyltransferase involved in cell wall biosynthesis